MDQSSRRHILRRSTASAHEALESHIGPLSSLPAYVAYARGLLAFRAALERSIEVSLEHPWFGDWRPCFIADALALDLAFLETAPIAPEPSISVETPSQAFGALYVLEGSALGARVLWLDAQKLGLTAESGARHLQQQGNTSSWRTFTDLLESAPKLDIDAAAASAGAAFRSAGNAMARSLNHAR